jgi:hypothetical protein
LQVSITTLPRNGSTGTLSTAANGIVTTTRSPAAAASSAVPARACGASSSTRSCSVSGPRLLLSTTSWPASTASRATVLPMFPLPDESDGGHYLRQRTQSAVHPARSAHDARHTAATLLLVQGVNARTVMDIMGWTEARMLSRNQHVVDELRRDAADRMGQALWPDAKLRLELRLEINTGGRERPPTRKTPGQRPLRGAACRSRTDDLRITSASL